jgi:hypothetical protein
VDDLCRQREGRDVRNRFADCQTLPMLPSRLRELERACAESATVSGPDTDWDVICIKEWLPITSMVSTMDVIFVGKFWNTDCSIATFGKGVAAGTMAAHILYTARSII